MPSTNMKAIVSGVKKELVRKAEHSPLSPGYNPVDELKEMSIETNNFITQQHLGSSSFVQSPAQTSSTNEQAIQ